MRPYRGLTKDGKWVYGWYIKTDFADYIVPSEYVVNWKVFIQVLPETVGQQTGLKDKKRTEKYPDGQEIYEGDIVYIPATTVPEGQGGYVQNERNHVVSWARLTDGMYAESYYSGFELPMGDATFGDIEIIGNVHENPELLEREDKNHANKTQ